MILWAILGVNLLVAMTALAFTGANDEIVRQIHALSKSNPLHISKPAGCLFALCPLATASLWTVYAVQVDDWRFAAISWIPAGAGVLRRIVTATKPTETLRLAGDHAALARRVR